MGCGIAVLRAEGEEMGVGAHPSTAGIANIFEAVNTCHPLLNVMFVDYFSNFPPQSCTMFYCFTLVKIRGVK